MVFEPWRFFYSLDIWSTFILWYRLTSNIQHFAVKVVSMRHVIDSKQVPNLINEKRILSSLNYQEAHPFIVQLQSQYCYKVLFEMKLIIKKFMEHFRITRSCIWRLSMSKEGKCSPTLIAMGSWGISILAFSDITISFLVKAKHDFTQHKYY